MRREQAARPPRCERWMPGLRPSPRVHVRRDRLDLLRHKVAGARSRFLLPGHRSIPSSQERMATPTRHLHIRCRRQTAEWTHQIIIARREACRGRCSAVLAVLSESGPCRAREFQRLMSAGSASSQCGSGTLAREARHDAHLEAVSRDRVSRRRHRRQILPVPAAPLPAAVALGRARRTAVWGRRNPRLVAARIRRGSPLSTRLSRSG
jgi:hypothetical protein